MKITRKQLRQIIKEEFNRLNEYEKADKLHEVARSSSDLSPQKKLEWQKLEAALKPFGYESAGVRSYKEWPFVLFGFRHSPKDLSGLSHEELVQHIEADMGFPGHSLEIRIPHEWYKKDTGKE